MSSRLLYAEYRAALARAARVGPLGSHEFKTARRAAEKLWNEIDRVDVTDGLVRRAGDLAEQHGLRGYDAVHLASLENVADERTVLVAADTELLAAARAMGIGTVPLSSNHQSGKS